MIRFYSKMGKYLEFWRISFLSMLTYRARYFIGITTYLIYISVNYFIWKAIFEYRENIGNYTFKSMIAYVTIGWISRSFYFNRLDTEIAQKVVKGDLALDLLKPMDFQWMQYSRTLGEAIFRLFLFTLPTAIVALFLFPISLPSHPASYFLFILSTFLAFLIYTSLNYIVGLFSIPLQNIEGLSYAKSNLLLFLTGLIIPFDMFPPIVQNILKLLPFGGISFAPLSIYLERMEPQAILMTFLNQIIWILALNIIGRWLFTYYTKRIIIQGG